jgi:beta-lysine 5,6-aminomutase alpha subunit
VHPLPIDTAVVDECRALAGDIAASVQKFIDAHTTVSIERTVLRAYGIDGADADGVPLVNSCVDRYLASGAIGHGIAWWLGRALARGAQSPQEAAEALAYGGEVDDGKGAPSRDEVLAALRPHTEAALARIDRARDKRAADRARLGQGPIPWKYVIVATGNIYDDADQARAAAQAGADVIAVIRSTAQ